MIALSQMTPGNAVCRHVDGAGSHATRLKRLGICVGRTLEVVQAGDPMILRVVGARIGLSKQLASLVTVEPSANTGSDALADGPATSMQ